jgi:hypothetical protein
VATSPVLGEARLGVNPSLGSLGVQEERQTRWEQGGVLRWSPPPPMSQATIGACLPLQPPESRLTRPAGPWRRPGRGRRRSLVGAGCSRESTPCSQGVLAPVADPGGTALLADGAAAGAAAGGGGAVTSGAGAAATGGGLGATAGSAAAGRLFVARGAWIGAAVLVWMGAGCGSRGASGRGSRWTTAAVTPACPELGWRDDHWRISSTTAGLSGLVRMSTLPSGCTARGTGVDWRTRSEGT